MNNETKEKRWEAASLFAVVMEPVCRELSPQTRDTGCGTQHLLRYCSHLAGRCPNSSSLFPPQAAVTAVAGHSIARPIALRATGAHPSGRSSEKLPTRWPGNGDFMLYIKVILQNTRAKIDKLHKGIMNRNVQNKKIKTQNGKIQHAAGCAEIERKINLFWQKSEKWLDNKTFRVYTVLVSHNGLVRQKGEHGGSGWMGQTGKFVKNAERLPSTRVELCVSAQI